MFRAESRCLTFVRVQRISAITLRVNDMARAVAFYGELLGLEVIYGGESSSFTSLRTTGSADVILNLEQGPVSAEWGRLIFYVNNVDETWAYFQSKGFDPPQPQNAVWGERYFHLRDPAGHELSFAQLLK